MTNEEIVRGLIEKYKKRLQEELGTKIEKKQEKISSREYQEFKKAYMPAKLTLYEKLCNFSEKLVKITPEKNKANKLKEAINICHLNITPTGATSFAIVIPFFIILFSSLISIIFLGSIFFPFFFIILGISIIKPLGNIPIFLANNWRLKASNQMVLCIFYVVTYMRHTSNLELAIRFASEHIAPPLSLDLKKVLWDVQTQRYSTIKDSLEAYLQTWKNWNNEFIESFHLIGASLLEGNEEKRLATLDKSLDVILSETYEKMLHYAQNLKSPITMLHMLGIILPILGLVILPLVVSFLSEVRWYYIALLYNIALPITVYYLGKTILTKRPSGYGNTDISEYPQFRKYKNIIIRIGKSEIRINPLVISGIVFSLLFIIGISPIILHLFIEDETNIGLGEIDESSTCLREYCLLDYREINGETKGPFGLGSSILSLFVTLAFGVGFGTYFRLISKNLLQIRKKTETLEQEFASGLFQLGNRLSDGLPAETVFEKVATSMKGTISGDFFSLVSRNIKKIGMGVPEAIFHPKYGALVYFPSNLIESSMKVLIESIKKGPKIAAIALINISRYVREMHKVNERLRDLMADVISSMTSQIKFLTPTIAGIVIGITSMVTSILGKLSIQMKQFSALQTEGISSSSMLVGQLVSEGVPTYYFQIVVGIYVIQITYILTVLANGIQNGTDKLNERYMLGKNLTRSALLYCVIAAIIMLIFNFIATAIVGVGTMEIT